MESHAEDFRVESGDDALAAAVKEDYRKARLSKADRALSDFAAKLTVEPWSMSKADCDALRAAGFTDRAIVDAVEVIGYFNYINRVADGLGVDLEPEMAPGHSKPKYRR